KSDMLIGEVVEKYPQTAYVMTSFGLHCVGCHVNPYETLEQGALGHGMPKEMFEEMIKEVNKIAENGLTAEEKVHEPKEEKVYITGFAAQKVAEFMKKDRKEGAGLRLSASPGGCAGYQYALEFDKPTEQDIVFEEHGVQLIVAKKQLEMLAGIKIDFVDGLSGTGFKIENPNAAGSCGCGKSFH
ncbi:MAG: iron-sulfur cluster assembly accessory protein, partial [Candidatus Diapherotrites archaeon]|nr:iron-sulfur cluster assembly accessory protein [Candidatus Diapherotrites archaeon]